MSSSYSNTVTSTYTVADVEKVVRSIKADLIMIAGSTKAMTEDKAKDYAYDIELLTKNNYLAKVDVTLMSLTQSEIAAVQYKFQTENASGSERPGGVLWPYTPNGHIRIVMYYTDTYQAEQEKVAKLPLKINWVPTSADISHSGLSALGGRGYSSNGFGANRNDYS